MSVPQLPPGAKRRIATRAGLGLAAPIALGLVGAWFLHQTGRDAHALGLLLGLGVGTALGGSWVAGTLLCFDRSITALQTATIALWPVRVVLMIAALVYASTRGLDVGMVFLGLVATHVTAQVAQAWTGVALATAAKQGTVSVPG